MNALGGIYLSLIDLRFDSLTPIDFNVLLVSTSSIRPLEGEGPNVRSCDQQPQRHMARGINRLLMQ